MFRTEIEQVKGKFQIDLSDNLLFMGSCFADRIGAKFRDCKFSTKVNPFGVIFNPLSIFKLLNITLSKLYPKESAFIKNQDVYYNFDFHSDLSSLNKQELNNTLIENINALNSYLPTVNYLILTFGTAIVYQRNDNGDIVANCHKSSANLFTKKMITQDDIVTSFKTIFTLLKSFNPSIKVILTVSPVRHIKDNLEMNSISKAILRVACHQIEGDFTGDVTYFPSYEIMTDDLRDYRFYGKDMVHPSPVAEDYIWNAFRVRMVSDTTNKFISDWEQISKSLAHRPFHPESQGHQDFLKKLLMKLLAYEQLVDVEKEIANVKARIL